MASVECVICYSDKGEIIQTDCCQQKVHQQCLDEWLTRSSRCMYCRSLLIDLSEADQLGETYQWDFDNLWADPLGYININTQGGRREVHVTNNTDRPTPPVRFVEHCDMETQPDSFYEHSIVIVLDNSMYLSTMGVPVGWMVAVNEVNVMIQLTPEWTAE